MSAKTIYDKLYEAIGNPYGVCGLMGNLYAESGLKSNNLQNSYNSKLNITDEEYTRLVDDDNYPDFITDKAGYGLAQWTYYTRKENLLKFAKSKGVSIADESMQVEFLIDEIKGYTSVWGVLISAKSIKEASDAVLLGYEKPANQSDSVKETRTKYGENLYSELVKSAKQEVISVEKKISIRFISDKINGITVNHSIPCNVSNYENSTGREIGYIVMHYTGNQKDTAKSNCKYFQGAGRQASAHFFVDDNDIYQSVELRDKAWHCGTKGTYYHNECRNANSIGIEMCCTAGNYKISEETKMNAALLCAHLCRLLGISASQVDKYVLRHYDVTHKECPAQMAGASNAEWNEFKGIIKSLLESASNTVVTKPVEQKTGEFKVRVENAYLNIRKGPGTNYYRTGKFTGKGVFTIVETASGDGSKSGWGKLKSGAGWISLDFAKRV